MSSWRARRFLIKTDRTETQAAPIRAALFGSDQCRAEGRTVRAASPILETCHQLTQAGYDPDRPLHCYRGDILALRVRSIGEGAALTVKTAGNGSPIFAVLKGAAGSPIDWRDGRVTTLAAGAQTLKPAHLTRHEVSRRYDRATGHSAGRSFDRHAGGNAEGARARESAAGTIAVGTETVLTAGIATAIAAEIVLTADNIAVIGAIGVAISFAITTITVIATTAATTAITAITT